MEPEPTDLFGAAAATGPLDLSATLTTTERVALLAAGADPTLFVALDLPPVRIGLRSGPTAMTLVFEVDVDPRLLEAFGKPKLLVASGAPQATKLTFGLPPAVRCVLEQKALTEQARADMLEALTEQRAASR